MTALISSSSPLRRVYFWHVIALLVAATAVLFVAVPPVEATVGSVGITPTSGGTDDVAGLSGADYDVTFTAQNTTAQGIDVVFPAGYTLSSPGASGISSSGTSNCAAGTSEICVNGEVISVTGATASGDTISVAFGETNLAAGTIEFTITVGITNPTLAGVKAKAGFTVATTTGSVETAVATASDVTIIAGAATKVVITGAGTDFNVGQTTTVTVQVQDAGSNLVSTDSSTQITFAPTLGGTITDVTTGSGDSGYGAVGGAETVTVASGVAVIVVADLVIETFAIAITNDAVLNNPSNDSITVSLGAATKVVITGAGSNFTAGGSTTVTVQVQDAGSNLVSTDSSTVITFATSGSAVITAAGTGTGDGTIDSNSEPITVASGVVVITVEDTVAETFTVAITNNAALNNPSNDSIDVAVGSANHLSINQDATNAVAAVAISPAITVEVRDAFENVVTTNSQDVSVAILNNAASGTLSGTTTQSASSGVATFSDLNINKTGTGYTLRFTYVPGNLASSQTVDSTTFNITTGGAAQIAIQTQPGGGTGGTAWSQQPVALIQDADGNTVTSDSTTEVTVSINNNAGSGTLSGTVTVTAASGVVTFTGLSIDKAGIGYTLDFTKSGLTTATSASFNITVGSATQIGIQTQPGGAIQDAALSPQPVVLIQDAGGNTVTSDSSTQVVVIINNNPSAATLSGTVTVTASSGVVTFSGLSIDKIGTGCTLDFTTSGLTTATSAAFNVTTSDLTGPSLVTATVNDALLTITYGETLDSASVPSTGDFSVGNSGAPQSVTTVVIDGAAAKLVLSPGVASDDAVTVSYTPGTNKIQDAAGYAAVGLSSLVVTNVTAAPEEPTPSPTLTPAPTPTPTATPPPTAGPPPGPKPPPPLEPTIEEVKVETTVNLTTDAIVVDGESVVQVESDDGTITATIPTAAVANTVTVAVKVDRIADVDIENTVPTGTVVISGQTLDITITDDKGEAITDFTEDVTFTLQVDPVAIDVETIAVFFFDRGNGQWVQLPATVSSDGTVEWSVDHITLFALLRLSKVTFQLTGGLNSLTFTGATGTDAADFAASIGGNVENLLTFDAGSQTFKSFVPGAPAIFNTLNQLSQRDALFVRVAAGRSARFTTTDVVP
ncbi:MAG: SwmB domain-containing protein, partial [Dehalococcoidia bacterium]